MKRTTLVHEPCGNMAFLCEAPITRFYPTMDITYPFVLLNYEDSSCFERRRVNGFITRRQRLARQASFVRGWRGMLGTVDMYTIRPFIGRKEANNELSRRV